MISKPKLVAIGLTLLALASGCARRESQAQATGTPGYETLELRYQGNNGTVTPAELAESLGYLAPLRLEFVGSTISGPASVQAVVTGDTDFGGAFNGAIIKLVAAKTPLVAVVGYYGVDDQRWSGYYVLENSPIHAPRDILGKKVSMNTLGAHSEFMLKEYLYRNQLSPKDAEQVTLVVIPPVNGEQVLRQGQVDIAVLGDIYRDRAIEKGGLRALFSDYELFGRFTAGSYVMKTDFIHSHPRTARKFVEGVARALEWARSTPRDQVITRFVEIMHQRNRAEDDSVVKYWRGYGVNGTGGTITDREFQIWIDWMEKGGELSRGQVPVSSLYTNELNPYADPAVR